MTAAWSACELQAPCVAVSWRPREDRAAHKAGTKVSCLGKSVDLQTGKRQACRPAEFKCLTALEFSSPRGEEKL